MRNLLKTFVAVAAATGALLGAKAASAATGVIFVHGTGDYSGNALSSYWTQSSINSMSAGRAYTVINYQGAGCAGFDTCSWGTITDQMGNWINANGITDVVVVTHSNGSSPLRYMLGHGGAWTGSRYVSDVTSHFRKVIFGAPDLTGTPLADKVTTNGTFANIANAVISFFGGGSYNRPAVWQQRTDRMRNIYNLDGTFAGQAGSTTVGGVPNQTVRGTGVYANIFSGDAWCGGYGTTVGLKATLLYGWGSGACSDGFIGCDSSGYFGNIIQSDGRLNHNQSRRSCHGSGSTISNNVSNTIGYTSPPPDYTISPAAQACNATVRGWQTAYPYAGNFFWYGCTSTMQSDGVTDHDCISSYGTDNGVTTPDDYTSTAYSNPAYYGSAGACPDSWAGDGECDLCMIAKYGYDAQPGTQTGADDCVNNGAGTTNYCADLAYYDQYGSVGYYEYAATH